MLLMFYICDHGLHFKHEIIDGKLVADIPDIKNELLLGKRNVFHELLHMFAVVC